MDKHTPTPWRVEYDDNGFFYIDAPGRPSPYIAATGGEGDAAEANAALIVKAVNSHASLTEAVRVLTEALEEAVVQTGHAIYGQDKIQSLANIETAARAALTTAKELTK